MPNEDVQEPIDPTNTAPIGSADDTDLTGQAGDAQSEATAEQGDTTSQTPDPYDRVAELDHEELIKRHPELKKLRDTAAGLRGRLEQIERSNQERQRQAQLADENHLRELRRTDPEAYAEEMERREAATNEDGQINETVQALQNRWHGILDKHYTRLTPEAQKRVGAKAYEDPDEYIEAVIQERIAADRAKWDAERNDALSVQDRDQKRAGAQKPNLGGGAPAGARIVTDEDVAAMGPDEYDKLFDASGTPRDGVVYQPTRAIKTSDLRHPSPAGSGR